MGTSQVLYIISRVLYYCVLLFQSLINTKEISALSAFTEKSHNLLSVLGWGGETREWSQETWVQSFSLPLTNFGKLLESAFSLQYYIFTYKTVWKLKFKNWEKLKYRASIQLLCPTLHQPLGPRPQISLSLSHTHTHTPHSPHTYIRFNLIWVFYFSSCQWNNGGLPVQLHSLGANRPLPLWISLRDWSGPLSRYKIVFKLYLKLMKVAIA